MSGEKCEHEWCEARTKHSDVVVEVCGKCGIRRADAAVAGLKPVTTEVAKMGEKLPYGARVEILYEEYRGLNYYDVRTDTHWLYLPRYSGARPVWKTRSRVDDRYGWFRSSDSALSALRSAPPPPGWGEAKARGTPLDEAVERFKPTSDPNCPINAALRAAAEAFGGDDEPAPLPDRLAVVERACLELERRYKELRTQVDSLLAALPAQGTRAPSDGPDDGYGKAAS